MPLTDIAVRSLKPGERIRKSSDSGGLQIWVFPNGSKLWRYAYRFMGKQKLLALGAYPVVGLGEARRKRDEARAQLVAGCDPGQKRKVEKIIRATSMGNTFNAVADEFMIKKERERIAPSTLKRLGYQLRYIRNVIGERPIADITPAEVLAALRTIEAKGIYETATRTKELTGAIFRYAVATDRAKSDPTQVLKGALITPKVTHRAAIIDDKGFSRLLIAIDHYDGQTTTKIALQILALVFTRPGELRLAEWPEFDFDKAVWTIPAGRMKMRLSHEVPLASQTIALLKAQKNCAGISKFVFPSVRSKDRPISENTLNVALRTLGYSKEQMTAHGFRASASTLLNESGQFSPDAIERSLSHQDEDEMRRIYNRGAYWRERVLMAKWWADYIDQLRKP